MLLENYRIHNSEREREREKERKYPDVALTCVWPHAPHILDPLPLATRNFITRANGMFKFLKGLID